jgi:tetratricopeptide (TPR) repeat protein
MRRFLIALFVCCLAVPARLSAETAREYVDRGDAWRHKGEHDKAIADYTQAIAAANPKDHEDKPTIFLAYLNRGLVWRHKGDYDKAIADYDKALAIEPNNAPVYVVRGSAWEARDEYDKAIADYNQAVVVNPNYAAAYDARGNAWRRKGEYDKAIADSTKTVAIDPNRDSAYYNLALIYATCPDAKYRDGKKAVENAKKAHKLSGGNVWYYLATLAAAHAESGDFTKAQEYQGKAIDLAPEPAKANFRTRLDLYKQGKPYHEEPVNK